MMNSSCGQAGLSVRRYRSGLNKNGSPPSQKEKKPLPPKVHSIGNVSDLDDELADLDGTRFALKASRVLGPLKKTQEAEQFEGSKVSNGKRKTGAGTLKDCYQSRDNTNSRLIDGCSASEFHRPSFDQFVHKAPVNELAGRRSKLLKAEEGERGAQNQSICPEPNFTEELAVDEGRKTDRCFGRKLIGQEEGMAKRMRGRSVDYQVINLIDELDDDKDSILSGRAAKKAKVGKRRVVLDDSDEEEKMGTDRLDTSMASTGTVDTDCTTSQTGRVSDIEGCRLGGAMMAKYDHENKSTDTEHKVQTLIQDHAEKVQTLIYDHADVESEDELDPVQEVLLTCEAIALSLREILSTSMSISEQAHQDHFAEVEPSSASLVSQADVDRACGEGNVQLKNYQLVGVNFLLLLYRQNVGGGILADEMGLGKTVQAITFLALVSRLEKDPRPHLVVAPVSLLENWQRELQRWCPSFRVVLYHGPGRMAVRQELSSKAESGFDVGFDVMLTCYSFFQRDSPAQKDDRKFFRKFPFSCLVMDEAHLLKDRSSMRTRRLSDLSKNAHHRLMLTGTPLQNDLQELWSLLAFLMPAIFTTKGQDLSKYLGSRDAPAQDDLISRVKSILGPFVIRRIKADVMKQLVSKTQKVELLSMAVEQAEAYSEAVEDYRQEVAAKSVTKGGSIWNPKNVDKIIPKKRLGLIFVHLRKIANHPLLVRRLYNDEALESMARTLYSLQFFGNECTEQRVLEEIQGYNDLKLHQLCVSCGGSLARKQLSGDSFFASGKCQALAQLLPKLREEGHRVLIFSQWTQVLDILEALLILLDFEWTRLDGNTEIGERQTLVDNFNTDENIFAFLLSTRAGGTGLNLTGADTVILHDVDFNPQLDRQAEDRCHRIGQTRPVTVYRLVSRDTVDESILRIANRKLTLDAAVLERTSKDEDSLSMGEILAALLEDPPAQKVLKDRTERWAHK